MLRNLQNTLENLADVCNVDFNLHLIESGARTMCMALYGNVKRLKFVSSRLLLISRRRRR